MIKAIRVLLVLLTLGIAVGGCGASKPLIRSDFDHAADFKLYHSFGFFEKLATEDRYESLTTQYLKAAVTREMESRGYELVEKDANLLINFNIKLKDKQQVRTSAYPAGYYGYRWGYYGAWGGYNYDTYVYDYTEGTLNIDMVDRVRKQMVWEGVAIGKVRKKDFDNAEKVIDSTVALIFQKFPFRESSSISKTP